MIVLIARNQPPWDENLELDRKFFTLMETWEAEHPESTFAKIMEKVNNAVTLCQPFLGYIPDSPFPACSLVRSLSYLLQLGTACTFLLLSIDPFAICIQTIKSTKKDVCDFTTTWFYTIETSLRGEKTKKFGGRAKKNLGVIRYVP